MTDLLFVMLVGWLAGNGLVLLIGGLLFWLECRGKEDERE